MPDVIAYAVGGLGLVLLFAFLMGFKKRISYGLILAIHFVATILTVPKMMQYMQPDNSYILFFAAIPTAGAMLLLYVLREQDTLLSVDNMMTSKG